MDHVVSRDGPRCLSFRFFAFAFSGWTCRLSGLTTLSLGMDHVVPLFAFSPSLFRDGHEDSRDGPRCLSGWTTLSLFSLFPLRFFGKHTQTKLSGWTTLSLTDLYFIMYVWL